MDTSVCGRPGEGPRVLSSWDPAPRPAGDQGQDKAWHSRQAGTQCWDVCPERAVLRGLRGAQGHQPQGQRGAGSGVAGRPRSWWLAPDPGGHTHTHSGPGCSGHPGTWALAERCGQPAGPGHLPATPGPRASCGDRGHSPEGRRPQGTQSRCEVPRTAMPHVAHSGPCASSCAPACHRCRTQALRPHDRVSGAPVRNEAAADAKTPEIRLQHTSPERIPDAQTRGSPVEGSPEGGTGTRDHQALGTGPGWRRQTWRAPTSGATRTSCT